MKEVTDVDRIGIIERRFEIMTIAKFREKTRIKKAMKVQDDIRKKTKGGIKLTEEIRRWRDIRYASSS